MLVIVVAVLGGGFAGTVGRRRASRRRLQQAARAALADAPEGAFVRVAGRIEAEATIAAPITGRACVAYELIVELGTIGAPELGREAAGVSFRLVEGRTTAVVDTAHVQLATSAARRIGARLAPGDPRIEPVLIRLGLPPLVVEPVDVFVAEAIFVPGEVVEVAGFARRDLDAGTIRVATGYREGPPTRLRLAGTAAAPLVIAEPSAAA